MKTTNPYDQDIVKFYGKVVRITIISEENSSLYADDIKTTHEGILARRTITDYDHDTTDTMNKVVEFWFAHCTTQISLTTNGITKEFICETIGDSTTRTTRGRSPMPV